MKYSKILSIIIGIIIVLTSVWLYNYLNSSAIEQRLREMMVAPISLQSASNDLSRKNAYKMVVFVDSTQCSTCLISSFDQWNTIINLTEAKYNLNFIFIVNPTKKALGKTKIAVKHSLIKAPINIDSAGVFIKENPQIPSDPRFHTFLLDENDNVILVGNPLQSKEIFNMLIQILEAKNKKQ